MVLLFRLRATHQPCCEQPVIYRTQSPRQLSRKYSRVCNRAEIFGNCPGILFGRHPSYAVKARSFTGREYFAEFSPAPDCSNAQSTTSPARAGSVHRLPESQPAVIRFGNRAPMPPLLKIASTWSSSRMASRSSSSGGYPSTRSAAAPSSAPSMQCAVRSRSTRRGERHRGPIRLFVVGKFVEKSLDFFGSVEAAEHGAFGTIEHSA